MHLIRSLFLIAVLSSFATNLKAQKYITARAGYSAGQLLGFDKEIFNRNNYYGIKSGYFVAVTLDSLKDHKNFRAGLQIGSQNFVSEGYNISQVASSMYHYYIQVQYCQIDFDYIFRLNKDKTTSCNLFIGPTFSYNARSVLNGNGNAPEFHSFTDSLGHFYTWYSSKDWETKNVKSSKFSSFNFGLNFGLSVCFPLKDKLDLVLENRYSLFLNQIININQSEFGPFLRGDLSLGVRFRL